MGGPSLNKPIVGMAATPDGEGYWLVASDGGIFAFGDAAFYGSHRQPSRSTSPSSAWRATPDGGGYWLVASDGGIFAFGDAAFYGSTGAIAPQQAHRRHGGHARRRRLLARGLRRRDLRLRRRRLLRLHRSDRASTSPSSAWPPRPTARLLDGGPDGGIFGYGDAGFYGSAGGSGHPLLTGSAVALEPTADGGGYLLVTDRGNTLPFGDATALAPSGPLPSAPIVGAASL